MEDEAGRRLVLVRHSLPQVVTGVRASEWQLSDEGRRRCEPLAERLAEYDLAAVVTSTEPKATQTGRIVAHILGLPCRTAPNLHEHERGVVKSLGAREEFQAQVAGLFEHPGELVFGNETADEAHSRFSRATADVLKQHAAGNLAIVTHGTVLTLFVIRATGLDPVAFWKGLGLPSFVVLSLPELILVKVVDSI
jgi:broad specificity phosphatase PhoE